jgi:hypothetical protein
VDGYELCINHQLVTGSRGWNAVNIVLSYGDHIGRMLILVSSTNKTDRHDITEILLKVALNTLNLKKLKMLYPVHLA